MKKINKTNAARLLDKAKIAYELIPYEVDESDLSAVHVAASLGENIDCVFKTLILHGDKTGHFVCVIPGEQEVDLKLAAEVRPHPRKGTVAPDGLHPWRLFAHRDEEAFPHVYPRDVSPVSLHLHQCGAAWSSAEARPEGFDSGDGSGSLSAFLGNVGQMSYICAK